MFNDDNIYESVANWWADKIRETTPVSEGKINMFKKSLADSTQKVFSARGCLTLAIKPNSILTKCLVEAYIPFNPFLVQDEMKLTPHMITVYDQHGNLKSCHSI